MSDHTTDNTTDNTKAKQERKAKRVEQHREAYEAFAASLASLTHQEREDALCCYCGRANRKTMPLVWAASSSDADYDEAVHEACVAARKREREDAT